jgi:hypothetical protein
MMRLSLPQELAATFFSPLNADIVGVLRLQSAAAARNESSIAQVKPWKIRGLCSRLVLPLRSSGRAGK